MAITVRTILLGLLYLVTFIFSANAVGLGGECPPPCVCRMSAPNCRRDWALLARQLVVCRAVLVAASCPPTSPCCAVP